MWGRPAGPGVRLVLAGRLRVLCRPACCICWVRGCRATSRGGGLPQQLVGWKGWGVGQPRAACCQSSSCWPLRGTPWHWWLWAAAGAGAGWGRVGRRA
ncbi:hypothetical protein V8C86DRAFT_2550456 [Haematococcus lacustris]